MPAKIQKRGKNSYLLTVTAGYEPSGKQKKFTKTIQAENEAEARKAYALFAADCINGKEMLSTAHKMTLTQFFSYWQDNYAKPNLAPTTVKYNEFMANRILAALGHLPLHKIIPKHCLQLFDQLRQPDIGAHGKSLSEITIRKHYSLLNELLHYAVKWDFIPANPLANIDPPKASRKQKELPDREDVSKFLQLLADETAKYKNNPKQKNRYIECLTHELWVTLALAQGLRTEEIFALQRQDIEENILHIRRAAVYVSGSGIAIKETKSAASARILALSPITQTLLSKYIAEIAAVKTASIDRWLFCKEDGSIAHPQAFSLFLRRFCQRNNLPKITPHLLRHMHGSYLMRAGVDLAATSRQLGHSNKSFTANTYIHTVERIDTRTAKVIQGVFDTMLK